MLGLLLVFLTSVTGQATSCRLETNNTDCVAPAQQAACSEACLKLYSNTSCSQNPGCVWYNNRCVKSNSATQCDNITSYNMCARTLGCIWEVLPCKFSSLCINNNNNNSCCVLFFVFFFERCVWATSFSVGDCHLIAPVNRK